MMDPLSITASAIAVLQAAGFVSNLLYKAFLEAHILIHQQTTSTIFNFVHSIRSADSRISSLCDELSSLQTFIGAVKRTLEECQTRDLAPVEPELWRRCDEALKDCLVTLSLLEGLINNIKDSASAKGRGIIRRAKMAVDLSVHGESLAAFQDKIHRSNIALQTMLHTITLYDSVAFLVRAGC